jgi:hypothetical protein
VNGRANRLILLTPVLGAVLCAGFGCAGGGGSVSRATATASGRRIVAVGDGSVSVQSAGGRAVVFLPSHQVTVERGRVLLDGSELATLPEGTADVHVTARGGRLTVTADGVPIATRQLTR